MSIEVFPGDRPLAPPPSPTWGEIAPDGKVATVLRVALPDRWVSFPVGQLTQWEHQVGEPELLTIQTAKREIVVTGRDTPGWTSMLMPEGSRFSAWRPPPAA